MKIAPGLLLLCLCAACDDGAPVDPGALGTDTRPEERAGDADRPPAADGGAADAAPPDALVFRFDAGAPDAAPPEAIHRIVVSVNEIPEGMSGAIPGRWEGRARRFEWAVPARGWTVDVWVESAEGWAPSAPPYLLWRAVEPPGPPAALDPQAMAPAGGTWTPVEGGHHWQAQIVEPPLGGVGRYTLQATVQGVSSPPLGLRRAELTAALDPFVTVDPWVLSFDRDLGHLQVESDVESFTVRTLDEPDGVPDFEEAMAVMGVLGGDASWREAVLRRLREAMRRRLWGYFRLADEGRVGPDSVRVRFYLAGDPDEPAVDAPGVSRLAVGGDDPRRGEGERTFFGRAELDDNNQIANDDTQPGLGVFTTSFVRFALANPITVALLRDYLPFGEGLPFGALPGDARFLVPGFDPRELDGEDELRALRFVLVMDSLSLALASVTAHEIGHSLGLVKTGLPPTGLLAGVGGPWVAGSTGGAHIDTEGFNLMQTGSSFNLAEAGGAEPRFNAPNLAYLRRRLVVTR